MEIQWKFTNDDIQTVNQFIDAQSNNAFVKNRIARNLGEDKPESTKSDFWYRLVMCLLTTQQRSGPGGAVSRFLSQDPFPLSYEICVGQKNLSKFVVEVLSDFGGIRRTVTIGSQAAENLSRLERGLWLPTLAIVNMLRNKPNAETERSSAWFIQDNFKGLGPKQSRNLLQDLGLTRYEIPIDSRITKWLNEFGFPVKLSAGSLSDLNYYNFISDGVQALCEACGVYPCVLDASIFSSYDGDAWNEFLDLDEDLTTICSASIAEDQRNKCHSIPAF